MGRRRFSVLDAMAMIAATAVGMAVIRAYFASIKAWSPLVLTSWSPASIYLRLASFGPMIAAWTVALFGLQWLGPRPPFRRLARSPGFAACSAGVFGIALCVANFGAERTFTPQLPVRFDPLYVPLLGMPSTVGIAVAATWTGVTGSAGSSAGLGSPSSP